MGVIRHLPPAEIEALLRRAIIFRIACCDHGHAGGDGRPYVVPIAGGYDGVALYAHTGPGRKLDFMRANPLVTVECDEGQAPDHWQSVIAEGQFEELKDEPARSQALRLIYPAPSPIPELGAMTTVFRIELSTKTGRYERPQ